jgi:hypothetical protein
MSDAVIENSHESGIRTALGTLLIEAGHIDSERLDEALRIGADTGERLGEVVVRMGWASEDDLAKTLAAQWHLRYVERSAISFDADALSRMSREEASRLEALPMQVSADGAVVVALAEPTDARLLALRSLLGDRIDCVVVAKTAIDAGLRSELLAKNSAQVASTPEVQHENPLTLVATEVDDVTTPETVSVVDDEPVVAATLEAVADESGTDESGTVDFDELAKTLSDGLSTQLASLRAIVVEAEATRKRDTAEIARLTGELADRKNELDSRQAELTDRNETIVSTQHKLRELADTLEHKA